MLPQTNFHPPFNITRASHLVLTSRDLAKARDFYTEVIGLKVSDESATTIYFRGVEERAHHSLTLKKTKEQPVCERVGFRVFQDDDLEKTKAHFDAKGLAAKFVNVPFQGRTLHVGDPSGVPLEFCARMKTLARASARPNEQKGADALRLDHFQLLVPEVAWAAPFYTGLGFRVSDYHAAGERIVGASLFRKNNPHDVVFVEGRGPRFHHVSYIAADLAQITRALDCAARLGLGALECGPAHGHGHPCFAALRDPDGHRLELILPAAQMIDIDEEPERHEAGAGTLWGQPPQSWFDEATPLSGANVMELAAKPSRAARRA